MTPSAAALLGHHQRRATGSRNLFDRRPALRSAVCRRSATGSWRSRPPRPCGFRSRRGRRRTCGSARVKGTKVRFMRSQFAPAQPVLLLCQHHDRAAFGSFIGQGRELRRVRQFLFGDARARNELRRLTIAQRDGAGLVEQQRVHVARRFDRAAGHGQHVVLHQAIHAGDADGRKQAADGGRDQADQQRHQHKHGLRRA